MISLEWSDALLTGVDEMDQQHRLLVDMVLQARAGLDGRTASALFEQITRDLLAYAIYHFATEERLMRQHDFAAAYPEEARRHVEEHRGFSARVVSLRVQGRSGSPKSSADLVAFLEGWLVNHIMVVDPPLARHIRSREPRR
jgi:hemerythrin